MNRVVQVLLSSYNGEKYIKEQLDSILTQEEVTVQLLIRDDGSIDGTREILMQYEKDYENIRVIYGENVGVVSSFFMLLDEASKDIEYTAFADQDDVWLTRKLIRAISSLERCGKDMRKPLVYCSAKQLVNEVLEPLPAAISYQNVRTEFGNALVENMCTGCTCMINKSMLSMLKNRKPEFTIMHDFWIYLVGTCFGTVIYDEDSYILYRQHGNNELGAASSRLDNYRRRIKSFVKHRGQLYTQAEELLRIYEKKMPWNKEMLLREFLDAKSDRCARKDILKQRQIFRQRKSDNLIFRVLLLLGIL